METRCQPPQCVLVRPTAVRLVNPRLSELAEAALANPPSDVNMVDVPTAGIRRSDSSNSTESACSDDATESDALPHAPRPAEHAFNL